MEEKQTHRGCGNSHFNSSTLKGTNPSFHLGLGSFQPFPNILSRSSRQLKKESAQINTLWVKANFIFCPGIHYRAKQLVLLSPHKVSPLQSTCSMLGRRAHLLLRVFFISRSLDVRTGASNSQQNGMRLWVKRSHESTAESLLWAWVGPASRCYFSH